MAQTPATERESRAWEWGQYLAKRYGRVNLRHFVSDYSRRELAFTRLSIRAALALALGVKP